MSLSTNLNELAFKAMEIESQLLELGLIDNESLENLKTYFLAESEGDFSRYYSSYVEQLNYLKE